MAELTPDLLAHVALLATRAPSIHNTQPWRLEPTEAGVRVHADRSRQLSVLDPDGRQLTVSCGAVLHHLEVAARAVGLRPETTVLPDPDDPDLIADVQLLAADPPSDEEIAHAVDILHRHTVRARFTDESLPPGLLVRLREVVDAQGAMLRVLKEPEVESVAVLMDHAEELLLDTPGYAEELASWVWPEDPVQLRADGLPEHAVAPGEGRAEEVHGRQFRPGPPATTTLSTAVAEHPTLVLLTTMADTTYDRVHAGRALSALLLQAAHAGVAAQPLGQVTDVPSTRADLRVELGIVGVPQMLLRLGHAEGPLETPRRPVDEVLTDTPGERLTGTA